MTKTDVQSILRLLKYMRKLSRKEIAEICNVSPRTVEGWFQGRFVPNKSAQKLLEQYLEKLSEQYL